MSAAVVSYSDRLELQLEEEPVITVKTAMLAIVLPIVLVLLLVLLIVVLICCFCPTVCGAWSCCSRAGRRAETEKAETIYDVVENSDPEPPTGYAAVNKAGRRGRDPRRSFDEREEYPEPVVYTQARLEREVGAPPPRTARKISSAVSPVEMEDRIRKVSGVGRRETNNY